MHIIGNKILKALKRKVGGEEAKTGKRRRRHRGEEGKCEVWRRGIDEMSRKGTKTGVESTDY